MNSLKYIILFNNSGVNKVGAWWLRLRYLMSWCVIITLLPILVFLMSFFSLLPNAHIYISYRNSLFLLLILESLEKPLIPKIGCKIWQTRRQNSNQVWSWFSRTFQMSLLWLLYYICRFLDNFSTIPITINMCAVNT